MQDKVGIDIKPRRDRTVNHELFRGSGQAVAIPHSPALLQHNKGETVIICGCNVPIAELCPVPHSPAVRRPIGIDREVNVPKSFFDPLADAAIDSLEGTSGT